MATSILRNQYDPERYDRKSRKKAIFGHSGRGLSPIQYSDLLAPKERALLPFKIYRLSPFARYSVRAPNRQAVTIIFRSEFQFSNTRLTPLYPIFLKNLNARMFLTHPSTIARTTVLLLSDEKNTGQSKIEGKRRCQKFSRPHSKKFQNNFEKSETTQTRSTGTPIFQPSFKSQLKANLELQNINF